MRRRFVTLDVFTLKRFSGNPLAVVFEPEGLGGGAVVVCEGHIEA